MLTSYQDSDPSEELPPVATKPPAKPSQEPSPIIEAPVIPQPAPGTPPTSHNNAGSSHKKGARSNHKKSKGKNQYTKDRDIEREDSPARSLSRDIQRSADEASTSGGPKVAVAEHKGTSKSKLGPAHKMSMLDMRRRVGAIMDFISRTQVDLAAEGSIGSNSNSTSGEASPRKTSSAQPDGGIVKSAGSNGLEDATTTEQHFENLNCMEMMDVLTRDMVKWQNQYS